jgi:hypothetical protein
MLRPKEDRNDPSTGKMFNIVSPQGNENVNKNTNYEISLHTHYNGYNKNRFFFCGTCFELRVLSLSGRRSTT